MSCMRNVDPYNNAPPGKMKTPQQPQQPQYPHPQQMQQQQYPHPQQQQQQQQFVPQHPRMIDPAMENNLLKQDLELAVAYIRHLGGTWPPPGH